MTYQVSGTLPLIKYPQHDITYMTHSIRARSLAVHAPLEGERRRRFSRSSECSRKCTGCCCTMARSASSSASFSCVVRAIRCRSALVCSSNWGTRSDPALGAHASAEARLAFSFNISLFSLFSLESVPESLLSVLVVAGACTSPVRLMRDTGLKSHKADTDSLVASNLSVLAPTVTPKLSAPTSSCITSPPNLTLPLARGLSRTNDVPSTPSAASSEAAWRGESAGGC